MWLGNLLHTILTIAGLLVMHYPLLFLLSSLPSSYLSLPLPGLFLSHPFPPPFPGEEDATYINWMMVKKGAPQRCECGHWFELIEAKPTKI